MRHWVAFPALALLSLNLGSAQQNQKTAVALDCTAENNDIVGMQLCSDLRDVLAISPRYREIANAAKEFRWNLHLVSASIGDSKTASAQAVTITVGSGDASEYFIDTMVMITSQNKAKSQAESILAYLDKEVREGHHQ